MSSSFARMLWVGKGRISSSEAMRASAWLAELLGGGAETLRVDVDSGSEMERVVSEDTPKDSAYGRGWPSPIEVG